MWAIGAMLFVTEMNYCERGGGGKKLGARTKVRFEMCKWYTKAAAGLLPTVGLSATAAVQSPSPCGRLNTVPTLPSAEDVLLYQQQPFSRTLSAAQATCFGIFHKPIARPCIQHTADIDIAVCCQLHCCTYCNGYNININPYTANVEDTVSC
jgi:hypothetical protein